jgi:uncharacterized protein
MMAAAPLLLVLGTLIGTLNFSITGPVVDNAHVLSPMAREHVANRVMELRKSTHAQLAVVLIVSTQGEPIEDLSHRLAATWRGGLRGRDDGLLLLLAVRDRSSRLEVGYGLEATIPDAVAKQLLDGMRPALRSGDYETALTQLITALRTRLQDPANGSQGRAAAAPAERAPIVEVPKPDEPASIVEVPEPDEPAPAPLRWPGDPGVAISAAIFSLFLSLGLGGPFAMLLAMSDKLRWLLSPWLWALVLLATAVYGRSGTSDANDDTFRFMSYFTVWSTLHAALLYVQTGKDLFFQAHKGLRVLLVIAAVVVMTVAIFNLSLGSWAVAMALIVGGQILLGQWILRLPVPPPRWRSLDSGATKSPPVAAPSKYVGSSTYAGGTTDGSAYGGGTTDSSAYGGGSSIGSSTIESSFGGSLSTGSSDTGGSGSDRNNNNSGGGGDFGGGGASSNW